MIVTDARSLYDSLRKDGSAVKDRRLRLELNILKNMKNTTFRWIRSEQMTADQLTKEVGEEIHSYAREVRQSGLWTLGDDARAPPSKRGRALRNPDAVQAEHEQAEQEHVEPDAELPPEERSLVFFENHEEAKSRGYELLGRRHFFRRQRMGGLTNRHAGRRHTATTPLSSTCVRKQARNGLRTKPFIS